MISINMCDIFFSCAFTQNEAKRKGRYNTTEKYEQCYKSMLNYLSIIFNVNCQSAPEG